MHPVLERQLKSLEFAEVDFDPSVLEYVIPKKEGMHYEVGSSYVLRLDRALLTEASAKALAQLNGGSVPPGEFMKCRIANRLGSMLQLQGCAIDGETEAMLPGFWTGWVPIAHIHVIRLVAQAGAV